MKNILFITSTRIGDAVLSSGLLWHLAETHPSARITVACGEGPAPLFAAMPLVWRVIAMRKRRFALHWLKLWAQCVGRWWDLVVDLRGSGVAWFLPARQRRIYHGYRRRSFLRRLLRGKRPRTERHRVEEVAAVLALATPAAPRLCVAGEHLATAETLIPAHVPVVAVAPAANWIGKQWRGENFIALIERLTADGGLFPGAPVAVIASTSERAAAAPVLDSLPESRRIDLVGRAGLPLVYACLTRCALYIGNDSGLMHMAAAAGIPTLGLFGPSEVRHYAPWGPQAAVVHTELTLAELVGDPAFDWNDTGTLMDSLSVDAVEEAARALIKRRAADSR